MYYLWKTKRIQAPSDYWNMSLGNKLVIKAFIMKEQEEKYIEINDLNEKDITIFPVSLI